MIYITTATTTTIGKAFGIRLTINQPTTGLVTVNDTVSGVVTPVGVIALGTAGGTRDYWGFTGNIVITNASAENITVNILNRQP